MNKYNKMSEAEYRKLDAVSYSFLKDLSTVGPKIITESKDSKTTRGLTLGSLVDKMMTESDYNWEDDFVLSKYPLDLSKEDSVSMIVNFLNANPEASREDDNLLAIADQLSLLPSIKDRSKRLARIKSDKFTSLMNVVDQLKGGKALLLEEDFITALQMVESLRTHPFTVDIFNPRGNVELLYQTAIVFELKGIKAKSLLDIILIDHDNKTIYPKDLKSGAEESFYSNFNRYKYHLQAAMYTLALTHFIEQNELHDYEIAPFEFIYISKKNPHVPYIFAMDPDFILDSIKGYDSKYGERVKGIFDLVDDYKWYLENSVYDMTREMKEQNGRIILKNLNQKSE